MESDDFDMFDGIERLQNFLQASVSDQKRVAPGNNDLPSLCRFTDVFQSRRQLLCSKTFTTATDFFATEAESTIDLACLRGQQKNTIRVPMDHPLQLRESTIAYGIAAFFVSYAQFIRRRNELPRYWIIRIVGVRRSAHLGCDPYRKLVDHFDQAKR
ncbi:hypothetical protein XI08_10880 [Bradyrhizobium sp. CCBAU 11361]|nr:hypothetical protein [Bradyrhizobium sp. CCBAU 11361]